MVKVTSLRLALYARACRSWALFRAVLAFSRFGPSSVSGVVRPSRSGPRKSEPNASLCGDSPVIVWGVALWVYSSNGSAESQSESRDPR